MEIKTVAKVISRNKLKAGCEVAFITTLRNGKKVSVTRHVAESDVEAIRATIQASHTRQAI